MTKNIFYSLVSFASSLILAFFVSPMILRNLGDTRYGVWALFGEVLGYYGLLDFGIRAGVSYFAGRALANAQPDDFREYVSTAFFWLTGVSIAAFIGTAGLIVAFRRTLVPNGLNEAEILAGATGFMLIFCLGLPLETFSAVLVANRRAFIVSQNEILARVISSVLLVLALTFTPNLYTLCGAQLAGKLFYWTRLFREARRSVPECRIRRDAFRPHRIKELISYGSKNLLIDLSYFIANRKDVTLITIFLGPQWIANFSFARIITSSLGEICGAITQVVRPNLVYHWARGEKERAYAIYYTIVRYSSFVVIVPAAVLAAFGTDFLRLWIGQRFVQGDWLYRTDIVLFCLLPAHVVRATHSMSWQLLFASHKQKSLTIMIMAESIVNVALALWLVRRGPVGLAIASAGPMLLSHLVGVPLLMRHLVQVSYRQYWKQGVGIPVILGVGVFGLGLALRWLIPPSGWTSFLTDAVILGVTALVAGVWLILTREHRDTLFAKAVGAARQMRQRVAIAPG